MNLYLPFLQEFTKLFACIETKFEVLLQDIKATMLVPLKNKKNKIEIINKIEEKKTKYSRR